MSAANAPKKRKPAGGGSSVMIAGALVFTLLLAGGAFFAWRLLSGTEAQLHAGLDDALGGGLRVQSIEQLSTGLTPVFRLVGVEVENRGGLPWLTVDQVDVTISQLESVVGGLMVAEARLVRPVLRADLMTDAEVAVGGLTEGSIALTVEGGQVIGDGSLRDIDLDLTAAPGGVRGRGTGLLGSESVELTVDTLGGTPSLTARSTGQSLRVRSAGQGRPSTVRVEIDGPAALEGWAETLNVDVPAGAIRALETDRFVVEGVPVTLPDGQGWGLRSAWVEVAGTIMTGDLALDTRDGLPRLRGMLETDQLDLTSLVAVVSDQTNGWNANRLGGWLGDIAITAGRLDVLGMQLENAPVSIRVEDVSAMVTVGPTALGGGTIALHLSASQPFSLPRLGVLVQTLDVPLWTSPILSQLAGGARGKITGGFNITASGNRPQTLLTSAVGDGEFTISDGVLEGLVQGLNRRGLFGAIRSKIEVDRGLVTLVDLTMDDNIGAGWLDLSSQQLAVRIVGPTLGTVDLTGPWSSPAVTTN